MALPAFLHSLPVTPAPPLSPSTQPRPGAPACSSALRDALLQTPARSAPSCPPGGGSDSTSSTCVPTGQRPSSPALLSLFCVIRTPRTPFVYLFILPYSVCLGRWRLSVLFTQTLKSSWQPCNW